MKNKTSNAVSNAMDMILKKLVKKPKNHQSDFGKEYYNKQFKKVIKKYGINHYSVFSTKKASIVKHVIRTIKNMMWRLFTLNGLYKWVKNLDQIVWRYNNMVHRTIKIKPSQVLPHIEKKILQRAYTHIKLANNSARYSVGDNVCISKHREAFIKGYTPNWSNEIDKIKTVKLTNPTTYLLQAQNGEDIKGGFYELELQRVKHSGIYLVEKVLKKRKNQVCVKWLGFSNVHNSWIDKNNIA